MRQFYRLVVGFIGLVVLIGAVDIGQRGQPPRRRLILARRLGNRIVLVTRCRHARLGLTTPAWKCLAEGRCFSRGVAGELHGLQSAAVSQASWLGWIYLIIFGSLIGFTSYIWLLDKVSPARLGTYAYVNPVVAVILGWAIAGETLSLRTGVAAIIVICAVALITTARSSSAPHRA